MAMLWITVTVCDAASNQSLDAALSISEEKQVQDLVTLLTGKMGLPGRHNNRSIKYSLRIEHGDGSFSTPLDSWRIRDTDVRMGDILILERRTLDVSPGH